LPCALELSGEASGLRLLLSHALRAASRTLILANRLTCAWLPLARLQALALLRALELKQFALLRTVQPPAALLRRLKPVKALLGVLQTPFFALLRALRVLLLSSESTGLPTLLQLFAAILRDFSGCVRLRPNALLHFVLAVLRAQLDSIAPDLRTIRHSVTPPGRTLLSAVLNALLTLLHALLEMLLPRDAGGGGRCLALRRSSRTLRRGCCTDRWSRSRHCGRRRWTRRGGRRLAGPCGCRRGSSTRLRPGRPGTRRWRSAPLLLVRLR
jgi:hypothetical protein